MARSHKYAGFACALMTIGAFAGCATTPSYQADSDATFVPPPVNPEAREILVRNALHQDQQTIALGAGDRFGAAMLAHHVALVRAEHGLPTAETQITQVGEHSD